MKSQLAQSRDNWLQSEEGEKCCEGQAEGQYLRNRIIEAFIAGWDAHEQSQNEDEKTDKEKADH